MYNRISLILSSTGNFFTRKSLDQRVVSEFKNESSFDIDTKI